MSHVDEGLIHAWIDGAFPPGNTQGEEIEAHIALCVDCRVRMEKARELKERAQVVMHRLTPNTIVAPPFEEVLARRDRERAAGAAGGGGFGPTAAAQPVTPKNRRRSDIFPIPFAWAATLILAVGAGWMGRELMFDRQADSVASEEVESAAVPPDPDAPSPLRLESADAGAAEPGVSAASRAAGADVVSNEAILRETPREAAAGFAAPVAQAKAADSGMRQPAETVAARGDSAPIVLSGVEAVVSPVVIERRALPFTVAAVTAVESTTAPAPEGPVLTAYVQASAESRWTAEPYAAAGLIGYEPIVRLEGAEPVRSERAVVDSLELLRMVYVIEGDTVEMVQELEQMQIALDEIVVTGSVQRNSATAGDSSAARRERAAAALAPPAARADDARRDTAAGRREAERVAEVLDTASVLASRNYVRVRHPDRVILLLGRGAEEALETLAARIR